MSLPSLGSVSALVGNSASVVYTIGSGTIKSTTLRINKSTSDNSILSYPLSSQSGTFTTPALQNGVVHTLQLQQINSDGVKYSGFERFTPTDVPLAPVIDPDRVASADHALSFNVQTGALQGGDLTALTFPIFGPSIGPSNATWSFANGGSSTGDIECKVVPEPNVPNSYNVSIHNLENGVEHELQAQSINPVGGSPNSNVVFKRPENVPNELDDLEVTPGNASCILTFKPDAVPSFDEIQYVYIRTVTGGVSSTPIIVPLTDLSYDSVTKKYSYNLTGLTNGLSYMVDVAVFQRIGLQADYKRSDSFIPLTIPGAATSLTSLASDSTVVLSWVAPASNGGATIECYDIYQDDSKIGSTTGAAVTYPVSNLDNGTTYTFEVVTVTLDPNVSPVVNTDRQESVQNPTVNGKPFTASAKPTGLVAAPEDESVTLTWFAPTDTGGVPISRYDIYSITGGGGAASKIGNTTTLSFPVNDLTNGRQYTFSVMAVTMSTNTLSEEVLGALSDEASTVPTAAPPVVTGFSVTANPGSESPSTAASMDFAWTALTTAAYEEASEITGYTIVWGANSQFFSGTAALNSARIYLTDGFTDVFTPGTSYSFQLKAMMTNPNTGSEVSGALSEAKSRTAFKLPGAPTGLVAAPEDESVTLTWFAPTDTGGVPISRYDIYAVNAGVATKIGNTTTLSFPVNDLTNGRQCTFSVKAVTMSTNIPSEEVSGPFSNQASTVPTAAPPVVTGFSVTANPGTESPSTAASMDFAWIDVTTTSAYEEASAITGYTIVWGANSQFFSGTAALNSARIYLTDGFTDVFTPGTSYSFQIKAMMTNPNTRNEVSGALNDAISRTAFKLPAAPTGLNVETFDKRLDASWTAPADAGSDIRYSTVAYVSSPGATTNVLDPNRSFTGLLNGENYTIQIQSQILDPNVGGWKNGYTLSSDGHYPFTSPTAPVLTATRGNQSVGLNWTIPSDGGFDIAYYNVYVDGEKLYDTTENETEYLVSNLENGKSYLFMVKAVVLNLNVLMDQPTEGAASNTASATPVGQIGVVQNVTVTPGHSRLTLNYTAPSTEGTGMSIVRYMVKLSGYPDVDNGMNTSFVFKRPEFTINPVNDTAYDVTVYAVTKDLNISNSEEVIGLKYTVEDCIPSGDPIMQSLTLNSAKNALTLKFLQNGSSVKEIYCIATDGPTGADYVVNIKDVLSDYPNNIPSAVGGVFTVEIPMNSSIPRLSSHPTFPAGAEITGAYVFAVNAYGISMIQL